MVVLIQLLTTTQAPLTLMMDHVNMIQELVTVVQIVGTAMYGIILEISLSTKEELGNTKIGVRPRETNQVKIFGEFGVYLNGVNHFQIVVLVQLLFGVEINIIGMDNASK